MSRTTWRIWLWVGLAALAIGLGLLVYYGRPINCPADGSFGGADPGSVECYERVRTAMRMGWVGIVVTAGGLVAIVAALRGRREARRDLGTDLVPGR